MNIELTDTQVHMLQGLLNMVNLDRDMPFSDIVAFNNMCNTLDVDGSIGHFDADSTDNLCGITLRRGF